MISKNNPRELTRYSEQIEGEPRNFNWSVRFDDTDGYIGITQSDNPKINESSRVLLSPLQVKLLVRFIKKGGNQ